MLVNVSSFHCLILQTTSSGAKSGSSETTRAVRGTGPEREGCYYALLEFEKPVTCLPDSIVIGSRLDTDVHIHLKISQIVLFYNCKMSHGVKSE